MGIAQEVKPPRDRDFRIVKKNITVDPSKRDSDLAPCNLCGPKPKFKNDGMLIRDEMGWLYLIGPICGAQHYQNRFKDEESRFDRAQAEIAAENFLLEELENIGLWQREALELGDHVESATQAHKRLTQTGKVIKELRKATNKNDGWLSVNENRRVLQADGNHRIEHLQEKIWRLKGQAALRSRCQVSPKFSQARRTLLAFGDSEDSAFEHVFRIKKEGNLPQLAIDLRQAYIAIKFVRSEIKEFQRFFAIENYRGIERWALNRGCPIQMYVEYHGSTRTARSSRSTSPLTH